MFFSYKGKCDKVRCSFGARCASKVDGTTECVCPTCRPSSDSNAVCGGDGRTYASHCHLRYAGCKAKKDIKVAGQGACSKLRNIDIF